MHGLEKLSFNQATISNSDNLSLQSQSGTQFKGKYPCWIIQNKGGYIRLAYQMTEAKDVLLCLTLRCGKTLLGAMNCPITIKFNSTVLSSGFDPQKEQFYTQSWHVDSDATIVGENIVEISLERSASTAVMVQAVAIGNFEMQPQQQTNWCWIAASVSTGKYFQRASNTRTQCTLYDAVNTAPTACTYAFRDPSIPTAVNQPGDPGNALDKDGLNAGFINSFATIAQVLDQLNDALPMPCGVLWKDGGGHTMVISSAYAVGAVNWLVIDDPWFGRTSITYDNFKNSYKTAGDNWKYTWKTQNP